MSDSIFDDETLFVKKDKVAWIALLSVLTYSAAFLLPVVSKSYGFFAFYITFWGVSDGLLVWLANPVYWLAFYMLSKWPLRATVLGAFAVALALTPLIQFTVHDLDQLRLGYCVWLSSHVLLLAAGVVALSQRIPLSLASKPISRRRFGWRAILMIVALIAVILAMYLIPMNRLHQQRSAVAAIKALNGHVVYKPSIPHPTSRLRWFARRIYGDDIFQHVVSVRMGGNGTQLADSDLQHLENLNRLKKLSLENAEISVAGTTRLLELSNLADLTIQDSTIQQGALIQLQRLPALRQLTLYRVAVSEQLLEDILSLDRVTVSLSIASTRCSANLLAALSKAHNITALNFSNVSVSTEAWSQMGEISNLKQLSFANMELTENTFEAIQRQTQVRKLYMQKIQATAQAWTKLGPMPQLWFWILSHTTLPAEAVDAVGRQSEVEYLNLNDSTITADDLGAVFHLEKLKTLALHRTSVTTKQLRQIHELPQLTRLELHATDVTDEICDTLRQMKGLKIINLTHTHVTPEAVDRLRSDLSDCEVKY